MDINNDKNNLKSLRCFIFETFEHAFTKQKGIIVQY